MSLSPELPEELKERVSVELLQKLSNEFDERCQERHDMGEKKYGAGTWLGVDTLEMAIEEVIDLSNYVRFSYVRLRLLQEALGTSKATETALPGMEMLGKDAFRSFSRKE